ncbi:regulatory helix-turn-helix protein, lysR family [Variovorax sp. CF079]|uniref:LysR family transcriptional regulator n=1 Tax=Variovorax sp. CF079 TaxID=1882774 RepID=UPI000883E3E9|nr:LysR family transcriptional regulator [Variovorax sp. CF079]SDC68142.1 regulatory helix-turn-helix protein, lysR family [Variovorax sp. CF079]
MNTDKNAMALHVRVVEAGSFSKAAAREGVPVSTVSRKIAELEKALGVRLLERSTRQLRMTEIGQSYFESCRRGLTEFEAADSLVTQRQAEISGRLRISIPPSMSDLAVVPLVSAFLSNSRLWIFSSLHIEASSLLRHSKIGLAATLRRESCELRSR